MSTNPELPFPSDSAIDEMNLVEIPFALLTKTSGQRTLELSSDGVERLVADEAVGGLPTALGERALIALLWYHKNTAAQSPRFRVHLRHFVTSYLFPKRDYRPNARILEAVQEQLRRIAHTRVVSNRWYDKERGQRVAIDASIIDYIKVIEEGGNNRPRILEIRWGELFFESLRARYTKKLDYGVWLAIERPLARRLYRWLDRQLQPKSTETVRAWNFGRFKLGMTHSRLASPGRRASKYLVAQLKPCLADLAEVGFHVSLEVDATADDFLLTFQRAATEVASAPPIVVEPVTELLAHFHERAHGVDAPRSFETIDIRLATEWLETYGLDDSKALVDESLALVRHEHHEMPYKFRRLSFYEEKARGRLQRLERERAGQLSLPDVAASVEHAPPPPPGNPEHAAFSKTFFSALPTGLQFTVSSMLAIADVTDSTIMLATNDRSAAAFLLRTHSAQFADAALQAGGIARKIELIEQEEDQ